MVGKKAIKISEYDLLSLRGLIRTVMEDKYQAYEHKNRLNYYLKILK